MFATQCSHACRSSRRRPPARRGVFMRMGNYFMASVMAFLVALLAATGARGFTLVIDSNTMTPADLTHASTGALRADGSYTIFVNTHNASDALWRSYMQGVGGALRFTEDNPGSYASCAEFKHITGSAPTAAMGYHETGGLPGGTLLRQPQVDFVFGGDTFVCEVCLFVRRRTPRDTVFPQSFPIAAI